MAQNPVNDPVLSRWYSFFEGLSDSPLHFYELLEKAITEREIPAIETGRIDCR